MREIPLPSPSTEVDVLDDIQMTLHTSTCKTIITTFGGIVTITVVPTDRGKITKSEWGLPSSTTVVHKK
jgi:hypothetical protein